MKKDTKYVCQFNECNKEFGFKGYSDNHKFCSIECAKNDKLQQSKKLKEQRYTDWINGKQLPVKWPRKLIREFVIQRDGYKCSCCGISEWNNKPITLWLDHIDGNAANDLPQNFRLMCPNCDSQSSTFGAKNYGNGRKSRGMPQYG